MSLIFLTLWKIKLAEREIISYYCEIFSQGHVLSASLGSAAVEDIEETRFYLKPNQIHIMHTYTYRYLILHGPSRRSFGNIATTVTSTRSG